MRRHRKFSFLCQFFILLSWTGFLVLASVVFASTSTLSVVADVRGTLLSTNVEDGPLQVWLTELAAQASFQLTDLAQINNRVSITCRNAPLDQALQQLLEVQGLNFLFIYRREGSPALKHVIVLNAYGQRLVPPIMEGPCQVKAPARFLGSPPLPDKPAFQAVNYFTPGSSLEQVLGQAADPMPQTRAAALEALVAYGTDERVRRKLIESVGDLDPNVRATSISLLGPFVTEWPGAEDAVVRALSDTDTSVRRLALMLLGGRPSDKLTAALNVALHDSDSEIRAQAQEFLDAQ